MNFAATIVELAARQAEDPACPDGGRRGLYKYDPSAAAAYIFLVLFLISTLFHIVQAGLTKTWYWIPFICGGILEVLGFVGRVIGVGESPCFTTPPYILMSIGTLIAPAFFAASIYMELGRIMILTDGSHLSIIKRQWMTSFFVVGDVLSILLQAIAGAFISSDDPDRANLGETLTVVGLFIQIAFFGLFMIITILWFSRMRTQPPAISLTVPWKKHLYTMFAVSFLIFFRSIFRVIEYIQGREGYLMVNEVFLYVFDVMLMWFVMAIFHVVHPSEVTSLHFGGKVAMLWKIYRVEPQRSAAASDEEAKAADSANNKKHWWNRK